jgi:hypothetical protein
VTVTEHVARLVTARIVADHWRRWALASSGDMAVALTAHPLSVVTGAVLGEQDPEHVGIPHDHPDAERIRRIWRAAA